MQFLLRHSPGTFRSRLFVAETCQEESPVRREHRPQSIHVAQAVGVGKDMEQAEIGHGGKTPVPLAQCQRIFEQELYCECARGCLGARALDRLLDEVDAGDFMSPSCEEEGDFARSATRVEDGAVDPVGDGHEPWVRLSRFPRRFVAGIERVSE